MKRRDPRKPSKYGAVKVKDDGHTFDSKREHRYYCELKLRERAGEVRDIAVHRRFSLGVKHGIADGVSRYDHLGYHDVDFCFFDKLIESVRYVEVKGVDLPLGRWKRKHCEAEYGIKIEVVK